MFKEEKQRDNTIDTLIPEQENKKFSPIQKKILMGLAAFIALSVIWHIGQMKKSVQSIQETAIRTTITESCLKALESGNDEEILKSCNRLNR